MIRRFRMASLVCLAPLLAGCGVQECVLDIAGRDCTGIRPSVFPQNDAVCRSYGLAPGTPDYARCREAKAHVDGLSRDASDYGILRNPLLPDVR